MKLESSQPERWRRSISQVVILTAGGSTLRFPKMGRARVGAGSSFFRWQGRLREMGLGSASTVSLAQARELAAKWRAELTAGRNPFDAREVERRASRNGRTFREVAVDLHAAKSPAWRNLKVRRQWMAPLERYAARLMPLSVDQIKTEDVLGCLQPIWTTKPETASRVRGRIEGVLDAARVRGLIPPNEANPARWRGHLSHLLPKRRKLSRGHHPAMAYRDVPQFIRQLRAREAVAALALEFLILTASRTNEVLGACWDEVDFASRLWTVPGRRMKSGASIVFPSPPVQSKSLGWRAKLALEN